MFVCREINGALAQHHVVLEELEHLEAAFRKAVVDCDDQMGDDVAFFPSSQPSDFAHKNRQLSRVSTHQRAQEADATHRVASVLEEPILAAQVQPALRCVSDRSDHLVRSEFKKRQSRERLEICSVSRVHSKSQT